MIAIAALLLRGLQATTQRRVGHQTFVASPPSPPEMMR